MSAMVVMAGRGCWLTLFETHFVLDRVQMELYGGEDDKYPIKVISTRTMATTRYQSMRDQNFRRDRMAGRCAPRRLTLRAFVWYVWDESDRGSLRRTENHFSGPFRTNDGRRNETSRRASWPRHSVGLLEVEWWNQLLASCFLCCFGLFITWNLSHTVQLQRRPSLLGVGTGAAVKQCGR